MAEVYPGYSETDERTVLLLLISDVVEDLYAYQRDLTNLHIQLGRTAGYDPGYLRGEIDGIVQARQRLESILQGYDEIAAIHAPESEL